MREEVRNPVALGQSLSATENSTIEQSASKYGESVQSEDSVRRLPRSRVPLTRVLSRTTSREPADPGAAPDGGLKAWTQALMGHLVVFNTWGYINSFGVFQVCPQVCRR